MTCVYCQQSNGVTIPIGSGLLAHRACFVEADRRAEALEQLGPQVVGAPEELALTRPRPAKPWERPALIDGLTVAEYAERRGVTRSAAYSRRHHQRHSGPRHISEVLARALAAVPGRPT